MTEQAPIVLPDFGETFDLVRDVLQDDSKTVQIRQQGVPLWQRRTDPNTAPVYEIIETDVPTLDESDGNKQNAGDDAQCRYWTTASPGSIEHFTKAELKGMFLRYGRDSSWVGEFTGNSAEAKAWVANEFIRQSLSASDLGRVFGFALDLHSIHGQQRTAIVQGAIMRSTAFARDEDAHMLVPESTRIAPDTDLSPAQKKMRTLVSAGIGKLLLGINIHNNRRLASTDFPQENLASLVEIYDAAGLVSEDFWSGTALKSAAAVITPTFIPVLHNKLSGEAGNRIMSKLEFPSQIVRNYITTVLEFYAKDPRRNQANAARLLKATRVREGLGTNVDLTALIGEANKMTASYNAIVTAQGGGIEDKFSSLKNDPIFVADAFLRLLSLMRRTDIPQSERAAQMDQDTLHSDVVSLIMSRQLAVKSSYVDLAFRFPDISTSRLRIIHKLLKSGLPFVDAVEQSDGRPSS